MRLVDWPLLPGTVGILSPRFRRDSSMSARGTRVAVAEVAEEE